VGTTLLEVHVLYRVPSSHRELWEQLCWRYMCSAECLLVTASCGNNFVGGTCALPSAF